MSIGKVSGRFLLVLLSLSTVSCRHDLFAREAPSSSMYAVGATPSPESTGVGTSLPFSLQTPVAGLEGSIYVGAYLSGIYIVVNLVDRSVRPLQLGGECELMDNGTGAICRRQSNLFLYDVRTGEGKRLPIPAVTSWQLTPDQKIVYYSESKDSHMEAIFVYDLAKSDGSPYLRAEVDMREWVVLPTLSNDGEYLAGARYSDAGDNRLFVLGYRGDSWVEIATPAEATYNLAWSPVGQLLVYGLTNVEEEIGFCTNYAGIFNPVTGENRVLTQLPSGSCYDDFEAHASNIWSPDGSQVALVLRDSLCLIRIESGSERCYPLVKDQSHVVWSSEFPFVRLVKRDVRIGRVAWSPDSRFVVYTVKEDSKQSLVVFSLVDGSLSILLEDVKVRPIDELFWGAPYSG